MIKSKESKRKLKLTENDTTSEDAFLGRRKICQSLAALGLLNFSLSWAGGPSAENQLSRAQRIKNAKLRPDLAASDKLSTYEVASSYNNFYEFSTNKDMPRTLAENLKTDPWSIEITGEVAKPKKYHLEDLLNQVSLEERIYRFRCVEAWSMVIPWIGFTISDLLRLVEPKSTAKYICFETLYDPEQMPGQREKMLGFSLQWPYQEALTMAEATNELAILVVGMYGKIIPNQNGAPLRLIVPWKYGFKSIKSIVKVELTQSQPKTSWNLAAPNEYGFYANVNPAVDHPRWSQKSERRILNSSIFGGTKRIETLPFNGYAEDVAELYKGLDLKRFF